MSGSRSVHCVHEHSAEGMRVTHKWANAGSQSESMSEHTHMNTHRFVFGTQESCALGEWERLLEEHLGEAGYVKVSENDQPAN